MSLGIAALILVATFFTATVSGVFGMAGGLMMKGVLVALVPVAISMVLHGFIQIVSNVSRCAMLWGSISWSIVARYGVGVGIGVALLLVANWRPSQTEVFLLLGAVAMMVQIPRKWLELNIERRWQAEACGAVVQLINTLAGVAGPLLDVFFVKTQLPRQTVVATKAATQVLAHAVKIAFWGVSLLVTIANDNAILLEAPPLWLYGAVIPVSIAGTWLGGLMLDRMNDQNFRSWTKWIVTTTGAVYLVLGVLGLMGITV